MSLNVQGSAQTVPCTFAKNVQRQVKLDFQSILRLGLHPFWRGTVGRMMVENAKHSMINLEDTFKIGNALLIG